MSAFSDLPRPRTRRMRVAVIGGGLALASGAAALLLAAAPVFASSDAGQGHGVSAAALSACQQRQAAAEAAGKPVRQTQCNPAAASKWPFNHPDPAGAALLGERQILAHIGWKPGDKVGISRLTYRQANALYPELAADTGAVAPNRVVWVVTVYFPKPVTVPFAGGWGPGGLNYPATQKISAVSSVVDALTGQTTDSGAAAEVPASPTATRLAAAVASAG